ncbi:MAG: aryl-sulfate sulfotransferase [Candidatus Pacebacteria bacterium]|nr:aryl-sulfate sulfotransferase [Candidatus Paceibacterota bacterium]
MKLKFSFLIISLFFLIFLSSVARVSAFTTNFPHGLTRIDDEKVSEGYVLYTPIQGVKGDDNVYKTLLINNNGETVHEWSLDYKPGLYSFLLDNGNLLVGGATEELKNPPTGGGGGIIQEFNWEGDLVWEYRNEYLHHDFDKMPNGNILAILWKPMSAENQKKVRGGIVGTENEGQIWADTLIEIDYKTKEIIWEVKVEDLLDVDDYELESFVTRKSFTHVNSIDYLPQENTFLSNEAVLISIRQLNMIAVIDKKNKKLEWAWGKDKISKQHNVTLLENNNILLFDNGVHGTSNKGGFYIPGSRVIELDPKTLEVVWEYSGDGLGGIHFFSALMGGAQRLENGNTLITESMTGRIFEVTRDKELVWEYVNPYYEQDNNFVFKAIKYSPESINIQKLSYPDGKYSFKSKFQELGTKVATIEIVFFLSVLVFILSVSLLNLQSDKIIIVIKYLRKLINKR